MIEWEDFEKVDMRVGRIVAVEDFPEARKPAWKLRIDFGPELGEKRSSAQITNYTREELEGRLVVAVVNFPPRQIGPVRSEVLVLGAQPLVLGVQVLDQIEQPHDHPAGGRIVHPIEVDVQVRRLRHAGRSAGSARSDDRVEYTCPPLPSVRPTATPEFLRGYVRPARCGAGRTEMSARFPLGRAWSLQQPHSLLLLS